MEDVEMSSNNNNDIYSLQLSKQSNEDPYLILDKMKNELDMVNNIFKDSLNDLNKIRPLIEKDKIGNHFEKERNNIDDKINDCKNKMEEYFNNIANFANDLKKNEEYDIDEEKLSQNLEELKRKNKSSNDKLEKKKKAVSIIYNELKSDNSMKKENDIRKEFIMEEDDLEYE